jgi:hypothetical protein
MTVDVECARTADAPELAAALAAGGLDTELDERSGELHVRADDLLGVEHAVEQWAAERGLPFVPYVVDDQRVVLAPPPA